MGVSPEGSWAQSYGFYPLGFVKCPYMYVQRTRHRLTQTLIIAEAWRLL